jgi:GT2 family glycosyltransferase
MAVNTHDRADHLRTGDTPRHRHDSTVLSVDVVVVAYNSRECLSACIVPLAGIEGVSIVVVDNACPERSYEVVEDIDDVRVIHTPANGGFAYGCNRGWRVGGSEYVLFLNPDARLDRDGLRHLAYVLETNPKAGVVGPRTHHEDGTLDWTIRRFPSLRSTYAQAFFLHHLAPRASWVDEVVRDPTVYDGTRCVDWLSGACLLVRRSTLEAVGGLDERFFMYAEDKELCWRVNRLGQDVMYSPGAICVHEGGRSFPRTRLLPLLVASRLRYAKQHHGALGTIVEHAGIGIGHALRAVVCRGERGSRRAHLRALGVVLRSDDGYSLASGSNGDVLEGRRRWPPRGDEAETDRTSALRGVRRHFAMYWFVWLGVAVFAVAGNELIDQFVWNEAHVAADDVLIAVCLIAAVFFCSYVATRKSRHAIS